MSKRYGARFDDAAESAVPYDFDGKTIVSANVSKKNLGVKGLQATLSISDLFGEQMEFHPSYNLGFTSLNAFERETTFRLSYRY